MSARPAATLSSLCCFGLAFLLAGHLALAQPSGKRTPSPAPAAPLSAQDLAAAQQLTDSLGVADWLGPLAPVALSPFFAITCLSGMALYGQSWVAADNPFLGQNSPLNNSTVFLVFLGLTLLTSIPRFTKVSKPFAQAIDHLETWSGIITMITLRIMLGGDPPELELPPAVVQLGFVDTSVDVLLMIAAAVNIFVINAVKFFFEVLIWITPVPAIDAVFELSNKLVCGLLTAIYGFSPTLATIINLCLFAVAAVIFRWAWRREVFFRTMLLGAIRDTLWPPKAPPADGLTVFPAQSFDTIPARARCSLTRSDQGWIVTWQRFLRQYHIVELPADGCQLVLKSGWITNSLTVSGVADGQLTFCRRYNRCLPGVMEQLQIAVHEETPPATSDHSRLKAELA